MRASERFFWPILIVIAICAFVVRANGQEPTNREPYKSLVELRDSGGQGTGTLIYKFPNGTGAVLTARHVAQYPGKPLQGNWIWAKAGKTQGHTFCIVPGQQFDSDMALVAIEVPANIRPIKVVPFNENDGPWTAAGYRDGALRVNGPVSAVHHTSNGEIIFNEEFIPGMSGGFVCNRFGQVVGVVVATGNGVGVASDGDTLQRLIKGQLPE